MPAYTDIVVMELQAKLGKYNSAILDGQRRFDSAMSKMGRNLKTFEGRTTASFTRAASSMRGFYTVAAGVLAGSAVVQTAGKYIQLADAATQMGNAMRNAGLEGAAADKVYKQLYSSAQRNAAPVQSLVDLYSKLALSQSALGVTSQDLLHFTDNISVALRVAGTDSATASGALLQLSQALGGGVVRAEEFNSMMEGTPTIVQAVARGLKEANGSVATLRNLVNDGKVSSEAFFRAFQVGAGQLQDQASKSQSTVGQAMVRLGNSLLTIVGGFDKATGASGAFADMITDLSEGLDQFDVSGFVASIQSIIDKFVQAENAGTSFLNNVGNSSFFEKVNEVMGLQDSQTGALVNPDFTKAEDKVQALEKEVSTLQAAIERNTQLGTDNTEALANLEEVRGRLAALRAELADIPRLIASINVQTGEMKPYAPVGTDKGTFYDGKGYSAPKPANQTFGSFYDGSGYKAPPRKPISISDYPAGGVVVPKGPKKGGSGGGGGGSGSGYNLQDDLDQLKQRTALLNAETEALSKLDPVSEDYEKQVTKIRTEQQLLNEAQAKGVSLTPAVRGSISAMAEAYAEADRQAEKLQETQEEIRRRQEDWRETQREALKGFVTDMVAGASATDALRGALSKLADTLMDLALDNLFGKSGEGGGILGAFFAGITGGQKRASGGTARKGMPYLVNEETPNSEIFVPSESGGVLNVPQAKEAMVRAIQRSSDYGSGSRVQPSPSSMTVKTEGNFTFNLEGANGDAAIEAAVGRGIRQAAPILQQQAVQAAVQQVGKISRTGTKTFLGM